MQKEIILIFCFFILSLAAIYGQPQQCGSDAAMTSTCATACVVCDIDGFSGVNDLTATGQGFPGFCTTFFNNMQYIAFIAGSEDLTIRVDVESCIGGSRSLEVGFFESDDCENFTPITDCDTDIEEFTSRTFTTFTTLTIGQHYYLVIDGSNNANCAWTFNVISGSTSVQNLTTSGTITHLPETCSNFPTEFSTTVEPGAANFVWTINGEFQQGVNSTTTLNFPNDGIFEVCVTASNACDEAPTSCTTIRVRTPGDLIIRETICEGECVEANGKQFCETGQYEELITFPNGCDSLIAIELTVLPASETMIDVWICNDNPFFIGAESFDVTGTYQGTLLSANQCDSTVFLELRAIECEIIGTPDEIPAICNGTASGTLIFSVDQGEPPLTYTYTNVEDVSITGTGMTNILTNNEIPNIPAGWYQIYIEDNFGNDVVVLQTVTEPTVLDIQLTPSDFNGFNLSCFASNGNPGNDGTLMAQVDGGVPPYTYLWSDGQTSQLAQNLNGGDQFVTVTDRVGCDIIANFELTTPPPITPDIVFVDPNCDGFDTGQIDIINVEGGTPGYNYALTDSTFQGDTSFINLLPDTYNVYVMDANGCTDITTSNITAPDIPEIVPIPDTVVNLGFAIDLQAFINVNSIDQITWTDSATLSCPDCLNPSAMPVNSSVYSLVVTSMDGCQDSISFFVTVAKIRNVFVPNIFSPNDDGANEVLNVFGGPDVAKVTSFRVFNRWGALLFEQNNFLPNDPTYGWDGTFKGEKVEPNVFVWAAVIEFIDGESVTYSGDVVILK